MSRELKPWDDRDSLLVFPRQMTAHQSARQIKVQPPPQSRSEVVLSKQAPERSEIAPRGVSLLFPSGLRTWSQEWRRIKVADNGRATKRREPLLTSPRPGRSFSDGPSSSRNTFLPW